MLPSASWADDRADNDDDCRSGQTDNCNPILVSRLNRQLQRARDTTSNSAPLIIKLYFSRDTHCIGSSKSDQGRKGEKGKQLSSGETGWVITKVAQLVSTKEPRFLLLKIFDFLFCKFIFTF